MFVWLFLYKTVASFSPLSRLDSQSESWRNLRLLKSVEFCVSSDYAGVPRLPATPTALLMQFSSLLFSSPQGAPVTSVARKTPSVGNALLANMLGGGVFLCCWNHLHLPPDLCLWSLQEKSSSFCSALGSKTIFLTQFASSSSHTWDTHMGYELLPLCFIHFPIQWCWALAVEELRWEQDSKINKYEWVQYLASSP